MAKIVPERKKLNVLSLVENKNFITSRLNDMNNLFYLNPTKIKP